MTLGTGIFLSSLFLGLIYLYVKTRAEWNWKKILIWLGGIIAAFLLAIFVAIFWEKISSSTSAVSSSKNYKGITKTYQGITIGDSISDMEFKYGKLREHGKTKGNVSYSTLEEKPFLLIYQRENSTKIDFLGIDCEHDIDNNTFNDIGCGTTSEVILKKYPNKVKIWVPLTQEKDEAPYRIYDLQEYGNRFYLIKNRVAGIRLYHPADMKNLSNHKECD